jgi:hypothetical protein
MNTLKGLLSFALVACLAFVAQAQTADEIIEKYLQNIGGKEKLRAMKALRMTGKAKQQGMEFPFTTINAEGGKQKQTFTFQGKEIVQPCFDGTTGWSTNFMTMKAEKMETEDADNMKREATDFPEPFLDYAKKGYTVTLEGKEKVEGTECFKIKLTKKPQVIEGKEVENVTYYFFDTENFVPLVSKSTMKKGQAKGATMETVYSDYQEVNGLYFPMSIAQKFNGQTAITIVVEKVEINPTLDEKTFAMPAEATATK